jgi:uncharacterized damage-inducible protein DinB
MPTADPTYRELLRGKGAHADPVASLAGVSAQAAGGLVQGYPHSIWQIAGHMNYWMDYELRRISGARPAYPEHAIESWPAAVAPASEDDWIRERSRFAALLGKFEELSASEPQVLNAPVEAITAAEAARESTAQAVLWQILVHNSYHVGQIALLLRCFGLWPPKAGGDTW